MVILIYYFNQWESCIPYWLIWENRILSKKYMACSKSMFVYLNHTYFLSLQMFFTKYPSIEVLDLIENEGRILYRYRVKSYIFVIKEISHLLIYEWKSNFVSRNILWAENYSLIFGILTNVFLWPWSMSWVEILFVYTRKLEYQNLLQFYRLQNDFYAHKLIKVITDSKPGFERF